MSDLNVEIINLGPFVAAMGNGPHIFTEEVVKSARVIGIEGKNRSTVYAPVWEGHLRASVYGDGHPSGAGGEAIFGASAEYALTMDKGRTPGRPMPPSGVMLPWMAAHGVPPEAEFPLRRSIGIKGIKARPFVTKAFNEMKGSFIYEQFGAAIGRALKRIWG